MLTLAQAAVQLGITPDTLRQGIKAGRVHARKVGPIWTVSEREVERYRAVHLGRPGERKR